MGLLYKKKFCVLNRGFLQIPCIDTNSNLSKNVGCQKYVPQLWRAVTMECSGLECRQIPHTFYFHSSFNTNKYRHNMVILTKYADKTYSVS